MDNAKYGQPKSGRYIWASDEVLWEEATIKSPNNSRAWMNYAVQLMSKSNFKKAEECLLKAQALSPNYTYVYINLGIVQGFTQRPIEAETNFKKALTGDNSVPEAYIYYAEFLVNQKRFVEAKEIINKGLSWSPNHEQLKKLLVSVEASINGSNKTTSENTKLALSNATNNPTPENYLELSLMQYKSGNYEKSIEAAQNALTLRPNYDLAYNNLCAAFNKLGKYKEALEAGEKGLSLNPTNEYLKGNVAEAKSKLKQ